jgi:oxygen-independent coproporphyrinogen-3 oxidase
LSAYSKARAAGFNNINLDLMHGLPNQTETEALQDLTTAIALKPEHISWYQLTIEPNTIFYNSPPALPCEDTLSDIQDQGEALLATHGYQQYEVSAYAKNNQRAKHNINYWQFGDYLGIGAGAHGKITHSDGRIERYRKTRLPADYLNTNKVKTVGQSTVTPDRLPLEFMMNALLLPDGVPTALFEQRTQLPITSVLPQLQQLQAEGLVSIDDYLRPTALGFRFLNTVLSRFDDTISN